MQRVKLAPNSVSPAGYLWIRLPEVCRDGVDLSLSLGAGNTSAQPPDYAIAPRIARRQFVVCKRNRLPKYRATGERAIPGR